jgi:bacterioferritin-associated ferredoxin
MTRKKIEQAVREHGLKTADQVYDHFDGVSCGVCNDDVEAIIAEVVEREKA